jgi:hypothetical protein
VTEISRETVERWLELEERAVAYGAERPQFLKLARWALERDAAATIAERQLAAARTELDYWSTLSESSDKFSAIYLSGATDAASAVAAAIDKVRPSAHDAARAMGVSLPSQEEQQAAIDRETGKRISDDLS